MQEQFIPIDIHANKLPDWLVSRRHCVRDWQPQVQIIREKINNAIQDMPAHQGIAQLLSGAYINYFHCIKIVELLKETEADTRNVFGRYGSQRMKDWQEIVRLYEKDNVYLSEAAQMLLRNVQYEVPSMKKQIAKCEQLQNECEKKEQEFKKQENSIRNDFNSSCQKLGIKGDKIKKELVERCRELPEIHKRMASGLSQLSPSIQYYKAFVRFMFGVEHKDGTVPLLAFMIKNGNTTTYEWKYKEKPLKVEEPKLDISCEEDVVGGENDVIDFGDGEAIDFGEVKLETGDIDWGATDGFEIVEAPSVEDIDFNISLDDCGIEVEGGGLEGGIASGADALSLLDNPVTRMNLVNDLLEVEAFLKVRFYEMTSSGNDLLSLSQLQNAETLLQVQTSESVQEMLGAVQKFVAKLTDPTAEHLHNIRHSPRYVDHLADSLKQKLGLVDKSIAQQKRLREKGAQEAQLARDLRPKLDLIINKTKELQGQIEADVSKKYKNRPVHIMGGVSSL